MSGQTSLVRQLESLKLPQTSVHKEKRGSVSFLYDFFEAKTIDADTHFSVAVSGLEKLIQIDPSFAAFKDSLFHETSKSFDRGVQSKESNEHIDALIEEYFYCLVSKYFQLTDTHKTIEWLIYRFKVNEYNVNTVIGSVLPYHGTRIFVRLLQTCSAVKDKHDKKWFWLNSVQQNGVPLSMSVLLGHCSTSIEFLRYVLDSSLKAIVNGNNTIFVSFLTSFCFNFLERSHNELSLNVILSTLSKAFKLKNEQLFVACNMILAHLCSVTNLDNQIVMKLVKIVLRNVTQDTYECCLQAVNIICKNQNLDFLDEDCLDERFVQSLVSYSSNNNFEFLLNSLFGTIIRVPILKPDQFELETYKTLCRQLLETSCGINCSVVKFIVQQVSSSNNDNLPDQVNELYSYLISLVEKFFPEFFDKSINNLETAQSISPFLNSIKYSFVEDAKVPLFIGLNHKDSNVRRKSVIFLASNFDKFLEKSKTTNVLFLKQIIYQNVLSDVDIQNVDVLLKIFSIKEKIYNLLDIEEYEKVACQLLKFCAKNLKLREEHPSDNEVVKFKQLKSLLLETYCYNSIVKSGTGSDPILHKLFSGGNQSINLLAYLAPTNIEELADSIMILNSNFARDCPLLSSLKKLTSNIAKSLKKVTDSSSNEQLIQLSQTFTRTVVDAIVQHVLPNVDDFLGNLEKNNFVLDSQENIPSLVFLIVLNELKGNSLITVPQKITICKFMLSSIFKLLSVVKIKTSEKKLGDAQSLSKVNVLECFYEDVSLVSQGVLPLNMFVCFVYSIIESIDCESFVEEYKPVATIDFHSQSTNLNKIFYSRLYQLLLYYSTPNPNKSLHKRLLLHFRDLFNMFLKMIVAQNGCNFNFFFAFIVNCSKPVLQMQTLSLVHELLDLSPNNDLLIHSLRADSRFVLAHLVALSSMHVPIRHLALVNLKLIMAKIKSDKSLFDMVSAIVDNEAMIVSDDQCLGQVLANISKQSKSMRTLLEQIVQLLISQEVSGLSTDFKLVLIGFVSFSDSKIKSEILGFYFKKFFEKKSESPFSSDDNKELIALMEFYQNDSDLYRLTSNRQPISVLFYLSAVENMTRSNSLQVFQAIIEVLSKETFKTIIQLNIEFALNAIFNILKVQLELTEKGSSMQNCLSIIKIITSRLRSITFDGEFIVDLMNYILPIDQFYENLALSSKESSPSKKVKLDESESKTNDWKMLRIYIALFANKNKLKNTGKLAKCLFEYLKLTFMSDKTRDNSHEHTRQTILYAIVNCVEQRLSCKSKALDQFRQSLEKETHQLMDVDEEQEETLQEFMNNINVDNVIDCMRESRLKETQKSSLLLISLVAPHFKKQILNYLVAIFTFIGTSLLQCDDQYSLAILFETMESIIPIIIESDSSDVKLSGQSDTKQYIISIFVESFSDIPSYRRLALFSKLIQLMGEDKFLPIVTMRILEHAQINKSKAVKTEKAVWTMFSVELLAQFDVHVQIKTLCALMTIFEIKFFDDQFKKRSLKNLLNKSTESCSQDGTSADLLPVKKFSRSVAKSYSLKIVYESDKLSCGVELLKFVSSALASQDLIYKIQQIPCEEITTDLVFFVSTLIELIVSISPSDQGFAKQSLNIHRKRIKASLDEILLKFNGLLSHENLIDLVVVDLLNNSAQLDPPVAILVKRKALELLNEKLMSLKSNSIQFKTCRKVVRLLNKHLPSELDDINAMSDQQIHNVQLLLLSIKLSTKFLVNLEQSDKTVAVLSKTLQRIITIAKAIHFASDQEVTARVKSLQNMKGSCILCITQILSSIGLEGIQFLSDVFNIITNNFGLNDEIILMSNISAISKLIQIFNKFLSPHLPEVLLKLLDTFMLCDQIKNLRAKLQIIWNSLANLVPKRVMFKVIDSLFEQVAEKSPLLVVELMNLFRQSCENIESTDVEVVVKIFKTFMIKALSYRSTHHSVDLALIERVEISFGEAFSALIPKLTESTFRPIFYHLIDWAIRNENEKQFDKENGVCSLPAQCYQRSIAFYRFCSLLADKLKSLFCVFVAPSIVANCSEMLQAYHSDNYETTSEVDDDKFVSNINKSGQNKILRLNDASLGEPLVNAILATLSKCFLYDLNGVFSKDCTQTIIKPIVNQVIICLIRFVY